MFTGYIPSENKIPLMYFFGGGSRGKFVNALRADSSQEIYFSLSARALFYDLVRFYLGGSDESILMPGYTCEKFAQACFAATKNVEFYGISKSTLQADEQDLFKKIGPSTKIVVLQHLFGIQQPHAHIIKRIKEAKKDIVIIDDSSQLSWVDKGALESDFVLFSFGRGKPFPLGQGGALIDVRNQLKLSADFESRDLAYNVGAVTKVLLSQLLMHPYIFRYISGIIRKKKPKASDFFQAKAGAYSGGMSMRLMEIGSRMLQFNDKINRHRRIVSNIYKSKLSPECLFDISYDHPMLRFPIKLKADEDIMNNLRNYGVQSMYFDLSDIIYDNPIPECGYLEQRLITLPTTLQIDSGVAEQISTEINKHVH